MEDCNIGKNVLLENVILDRQVTISDNVVLQGTPDNPVVLGKGVTISKAEAKALRDMLNALNLED